MNELPPTLERIGEELARAVREERRRARRRRRGALVISLVVIGASLGALGPWRGSPGISDARAAEIMRGLETVLAPPADPDEVSHVTYEARGWGGRQHGFRYRSESWQRGCAGRLVQLDTDVGLPGAEQATTADGRQLIYDPRVGQIVLGPRDSCRADAGRWTQLEGWREGLASGVYELAGTGSYEGRPTIRIHRRNEPDDHYLEVDARTLMPLHLIQPAGFYSDEGTEYAWPVSEQLPPTADNLALLDLRAAHPEASVRAVSLDRWWRLRNELFGAG